VGVQKLTDQEISAELAALKGWSIQNGKLHRAFECKDFVHAFGFMTSVALTAEAMGHHPDWSNSWNKVTVDLSTHSVSGLSNSTSSWPGRSRRYSAADARAVGALRLDVIPSIPRTPIEDSDSIGRNL